jgi:hypothetical protein
MRMLAFAFVARPGRIDPLKLAAVSGAVLGSWAAVYGAGRVLFAVFG